MTSMGKGGHHASERRSSAPTGEMTESQHALTGLILGIDESYDPPSTT